MKFKCPHCGTVMGCIECAGYLCDGCGTDLKDVAPKSDETVVCQLNPWGYDPLPSNYNAKRYVPVDNDNDDEEMWDD